MYKILNFFLKCLNSVWILLYTIRNWNRIRIQNNRITDTDPDQEGQLNIIYLRIHRIRIPITCLKSFNLFDSLRYVQLFIFSRRALVFCWDPLYSVKSRDEWPFDVTDLVYGWKSPFATILSFGWLIVCLLPTGRAGTPASWIHRTRTWRRKKTRNLSSERGSSQTNILVRPLISALVLCQFHIILC